MWRERLETVTPLIEPWLTHQRRDDYWRHGSVCEDYAAITCAVYAVSGWADGYRNAVLRLLEGLDVPRKGLIGPWSHTYPVDGSAAGPGDRLPAGVHALVGPLAEGRGHRHHGRADAAHLDPGVGAAAPTYDERPGRWVAEPRWPSPGVVERQFHLGDRPSRTSRGRRRRA